MVTKGFERLDEIQKASREYRIGKALADMLDLKVKDDLIKTSWGTKTLYGLALCVIRIIEETK